MEPRENKQAERAAPAPGLVQTRCQPFFCFFFHLPGYQIGCSSKNLVPRNECTHAFLKGLLFYVFNWISLYFIAIKFVCLCFRESKMCVFSASVWEGKTQEKQSMVRFVPLFSFCDLDKWKSSNDIFNDDRLFLKRGVISLVIVKTSDQCQYLINCTPTPPLTQH